MPTAVNQKGLVLLYALLVISLITAIAIAVSTIVINELKLTGGATEATLAYYAAESGIEKGLYAVKIFRNDPAIKLEDAVLLIGQYVADDFLNQAKYSDDQTSAKSSGISHVLIKENGYVQADYYDVDAPLGTAPVVSMTIKNGPPPPAESPDSASWAEISWVAWDSNGVLGTSTSAKKVLGPTDLQPDTAEDSGWPINLNTFGGSFTPAGYRVRIKALFGDLSDVTVNPYDAPGGPPPPQGSGTGQLVTDLPSQIEIKSVGTKSSYKQSLTATVPWKVPLFGLYDYVIFSEGEIIKTTILSRPVYSSGVIQIEADATATCTDTNCIPGSPCRFVGWLAESCSVISAPTCTVNPIPPSWCTLRGATNEFFKLPIPEDIPASEEYYLSLRYKPGINSQGTLEMLIDDPNEGELGFTFDYSGGISPDWDTCTIADSFALSAESARKITYTNQLLGANNNIDLDWYQISTSKIFKDCPQRACAPACTGDPCDSDPDECKVYHCNNANQCNATCDFVRTKQAPGDCSLTSDSCCASGCNYTNDSDCPSPPNKEYLRYIARDENGVDLATTMYTPGRSEREIQAWVNQKSGGALELKGVWAADQNHVWAVGDSGTIYYTSDGGATWGSQTSGTTETLRGVWGANANNVWAVGNDETILFTSNGGSNWQELAHNDGSNVNYNGIIGTSNQNIWVVGGRTPAFPPSTSVIKHSGDGIIWNDQTSCGGTNDLFSVWAADVSNVWVVGRNGTICYSSNGGTNWGVQNSNAAGTVLYGISGVSSNNIWIVGSNGVIRYSNDGGINWQTQTSSIGGTLYSVLAYYEYGNPRALIGATSGIAEYFNGSTWSQQRTGSIRNIRGIHAYDYDNIWTAGGSEEIFHVNLPGSIMTVGTGFDQYWYSRQYSSLDPPSGTYYGNLNVVTNTGANNNHVYVKLSVGYCTDGCDEIGDFVTLGSSGEQDIKGSSGVFISDINIATGDIPYTNDFRFWTRLWASQAPSPAGTFINISVSGREAGLSVLGDPYLGYHRNSYIEIPGP